MREISPAENLSVDDFLKLVPIEIRQRVTEIRIQKKNRSRPTPSSKLIDGSILLAKPQREELLNRIANLVDENLKRKSFRIAKSTCQAFSPRKALRPRCRCAVLGTAIYYFGGDEVFRWQHAWVRVGREVIDANVDCLFENPMVPLRCKCGSLLGTHFLKSRLTADFVRIMELLCRQTVTRRTSRGLSFSHGCALLTLSKSPANHFAYFACPTMYFYAVRGSLS